MSKLMEVKVEERLGTWTKPISCFLFQCYKQPKVPDNYAPRRCYQKPTAPVEGNTTYKMSYLPVAGGASLRSEVKRPTGNITRSEEPMESYTVQRVGMLFLLHTYSYRSLGYFTLS